ncbi:MAG: outer membrane protein assembly factor BamA [Candidatus Cloacimonadia bacterium]
MSSKQSGITLLIALLICFSFPLLGAEGQSTQVKKVKVQGNRLMSSSKLRSVMDTKEKGIVNKLLFWRKGVQFDENLFEYDLDRIINLYQKEGFLNAEIVETATKYTPKRDKITLLISLNEGVRVKISEINYKFVDAETSEQELNRLAKLLNLKKHSYFRDDLLKKDIIIIEDFYDKLGFPYVKTDYQLTVSESETEVAVTYKIKKGPLGYLDTISFKGLDRVKELYLNKYLIIEQGEQYNPVKIEKSRRTLQSLGMFQYVNANVILNDYSEALPVEIIVRENDSINAKFGVGYGIEEKIRIYTEISKLRFLGGLRKGVLYIKHSSLEPINIDLKLIQPGIPTPYSAIILNPFYRLENEPGYKIERVGGNTSIQQRLTEHSSTSLTYTFENNYLKSSVEHKTPAERRNTNDDIRLSNYRKSSVTWTLLRDTSSPRFYPDRGIILSNSITLSGIGFNSDFHFLRVIPEARYFLSLKKGYVFATRLKLGYLKDLTADNYIPIEERFYAGGSHSNRGWSRSALGPLTADNEPLGGMSLIDGSFELRTPLWQNLTMVWFFDYGNVWLENMEYELDELRFGVGGGLRYATPFGPIRLDIGSPIKDKSKKVQFFISLGQAF